MITRRVLEDPNELALLAPEWRALVAETQIDEIALSPGWVTTWWRVFGDSSRQLKAVVFREDGKLCALALLLRRRHLYGGFVPFWRIELCCTGEDQKEEICSPYVGVLVRRGLEAAISDALVAALLGGELGSWDELLLTAMRGSDAFLPPFVDALRRRGASPVLETVNRAAFIRLPSTWDEYLAGLSGQRRYFVRRTLRDIQPWLDSGGREIVAVTEADVARGQELLYELHGERWRAEGHAGVFDAPRFRAFHEAIMAGLAKGQDGSLQLSWLEKDGVVFAILYSFLYAGRVHFYQAGRKLDVDKAFRPGIAAHLFAIRRAIEAGHREYDFLEGAHMYKSQLTSDERPVVELRAVAPRIRARALESSRERLIEARQKILGVWERLRRLPKGRPSG